MNEDEALEINPYALRCPVCEGLDYPGLSHNPEAPYCTEWMPDELDEPDE